MSDTPRTIQEECYGICWAACERIEELEAQVRAAANRIKRLEKAGDELLMWLGEDISESNGQLLQDAWNKAKEDKP